MIEKFLRCVSFTQLKVQVPNIERFAARQSDYKLGSCPLAKHQNWARSYRIFVCTLNMLFSKNVWGVYFITNWLNVRAVHWIHFKIFHVLASECNKSNVFICLCTKRTLENSETIKIWKDVKQINKRCQ